MKTKSATKNLFKAVKSDIRKACKSVNNVAKDYFAKYKVIDNYGTSILCWTMKGAYSWLPYCSERAMIVETYDYTPLVKRIHEV